jgi:hypothetical protein
VEKIDRNYILAGHNGGITFLAEDIGGDDNILLSLNYYMYD